jgi:ketosteroid isomerase-like protein
MNLRLLLCPISLVALTTAFALGADEPAKDKEKEDPVHAELRLIRDDLIKAVNTSDRDLLLKHLHPNITVTWMNGEVSRGPDEVKAYYDRMMSGPSKIVESVTIKPEATRLSDIYGDTAYSHGKSDDHFKLTSGLEFDVQNRWSAVLVKQDGKWKVVGFHASANLFDNPLLNAAKKTAMWAAIIAGVVGLGVGFLGARLLGGKPAAA